MLCLKRKTDFAKQDIESSYRLSFHAIDNQRATISKIAETQNCLDVRSGPVLAADLFDVRDDNQILFLVANHLCVDMVSWRMVLQDIQEFISSESLPPEKPLSFKTWCEMQIENSKTDDDRSRLPFVTQPPNLSYWGMERSPNAYGHVKMETFTLDEQATAFILGRCHEVLRTEMIDILLSAVIHSFKRVFTDRSVPTLYNEGHGREPWDSDIDLSRTVGWFTALCPLDVQVNSGKSFFNPHSRDIN